MALDPTSQVLVEKGSHNRIDLTFLVSQEQVSDSRTKNAAFVATEALLGEERLNHWIGLIQTSAAPSEGVPLDHLSETVDEQIELIRDSLEPKPHAERMDDATWSSLSLNPEETDDYPRWDDLYAAMTMNVDLWFAAHQSSLFSSRRFSRCGELFAFIKLDGARWPENDPDRFTVEDVVNASLAEQGCGAVTGGGTGLRYSYIDLALINTDRALSALTDALRRQGVGRHSWVLFFDDDLAAEWVGVYSDTPPPFGLPE